MAPIRAIAVLERRLRFLYAKLKARTDDTAESYDLAEASALESAITALEVFLDSKRTNGVR